MRQKENHKTLWTKNFTIITAGTIISAIGGTAMSFAMSFVVFDNSQSTLLAGIFSAISLIPAALLPVFISPYLDRFRRKPVIVGLDFFNGIIYLLFGWYLLHHPFHYFVYLLFSFIISSTGTIYDLAYTSFYPNLIEAGFAQKGYTVSSMIYPTVTVLMTPVAGILYQNYGMAFICFLEGALLVTAACMETQISAAERQKRNKKFSIREYAADLKDGFLFLKQEKGLLRIYTYISFTQSISQGNTSIIIAYFQTAKGLGTALYAWFTVVEFIGRSIGGILNYRFEIPPQKRFGFAYLVYQLYNVMDGILLFTGYPLMLANRMLCGFLGINSATLRESSVQNFIPDDKRAKLNSFFHALLSLVSMVCYMLMGALGEVVPYRFCLLITAVINLTLCYGIMYRGRDEVKRIYNRKY